MAEPIDWMQYAEKSNQDQGHDWSQYAEQAPQRASLSQGIQEGFAGAFPAAGHMLSGLGGGLYDMAGGNLPESDSSFMDALKGAFGVKTEHPEAYTPQNLGQDLVSGFLKGGRAVGNAAGNSMNYLGKVLYGDRPDVKIPDFTLPDYINDFDYDELVGAKGGRPASELVQGASSFIPALGASMGNPYLAMAIHSAGENQNPLTNMLGAGILHTASHVAPKAVKSGTKVAKDTANKVIAEPIKGFREAGRLEESILKNKKGKLDAEQQKQMAQESLSNILSEYLNEQPGPARQNASNALKDAGKELQETGSGMYQDFNQGKSGQQRIFEPLSPEFFDKQYKFPKGALSENTQKMIDNTIGTYSETMTRNPLTGQPEFSVNKKSAQPKVEDYINLEKHLRDEGASLRKRASSQDMSKGDADVLRGQANSLDRLRKDLKEKINGTLPRKQQVIYQGIQNFWKDYVEPFRQNPTLKNASKTTSSIKTNKILESLEKGGHHALKDVLLENPKVAEAIGKHDLRAVNIKNPEALKRVIEGDLGKTLPENLKQGLRKHYETLIDADKTVEALKNKLNEEGLTHAEIDQKLSKYKKLTSLTGISGGALYALKLLMGIF